MSVFDVCVRLKLAVNLQNKMKSLFARKNWSRWIVSVALIAVVSLMFVRTTAAEDKPVADKAWSTFERARQPAPPPKEWYTKEPTEDEIAAHYAKQAVRATEAADMAKAFYQDYPKDERAQQARLFEYQLLGAVMQLGDDSVAARVREVETQLINDKSIPEEERVALMLMAARNIVQNATKETLKDALGESSQAILKIMDQFPDNPGPVQLLLQIADIQMNVGDDVKAAKLFQRIIDGPYPDELKQAARAKMATFDQLGKPPEIAFTSVDGREINIADLKGQVVLIDFWATWCGPCMAGLPELLETYEKFHPQGFEILGINMDQDVKSLEKTVKENDMKWPQSFASENDNNRIAIKYQIAAIPTLWLVGKDGNLRYLNARADLAGKIEKLLAE